MVDTPCAPYVRCTYGLHTYELEGVIVRENEPVFCNGQSDTLIFGDGCIETELSCGPL